MSPKPWENAEGYADPTAYNAAHIAEEIADVEIMLEQLSSCLASVMR